MLIQSLHRTVVRSLLQRPAEAHSHGALWKMRATAMAGAPMPPLPKATSTKGPSSSSPPGSSPRFQTRSMMPCSPVRANSTRSAGRKLGAGRGLGGAGAGAGESGDWLAGIGTGATPPP